MEKIPDLSTPASEGELNIKKTMKKAGYAVLAASALTTAGCTDQVSSKQNEAIDHDRFEKHAEEFDKVFESADSTYNENLKEYYQSINLRSFPTNMSELTKARAQEIAQKKSFKVGNNTTVSYKSVAGVPVEIRIDNMVVPVSPSDYTPEELELVRAVGEIEPAGSRPQPSSEPEKFTNPDIKDFL